MARARGSTSAAAVQPSKGKKITFGEDDNESDLDFHESYEAGPSRTRVTEESDDDDDDEAEDSDDDAPEAVGLGRNEKDVSAAAELLAEYV